MESLAKALVVIAIWAAAAFMMYHPAPGLDAKEILTAASIGTGSVLFFF